MQNTDSSQAQYSEIIRTQSEVVGQLKGLTLMIQQQHESTNRRIDDLHKSIEQRQDRLEDRVERLEESEKKIIWKVGGITGLIAAASAVGIELLKTRFS